MGFSSKRERDLNSRPSGYEFRGDCIHMALNLLKITTTSIFVFLEDQLKPHKTSICFRYVLGK